MRAILRELSSEAASLRSQQGQIIRRIFGSVAQWLEQDSYKAQAEGSTPSAPISTRQCADRVRFPDVPLWDRSSIG